MSDVIERITTYLITGGLFNPELADHFAVRNLLIDASVELSAERERRSHYQRIAAELTDKLNGTPCAEIRWQQERDALLALLREAREALEPFGKLSDITLGSDIEVINGVYIGDLRNARAVYEKIKRGGDE